MFNKISQKIRSIFLNGLALMLPITLTVGLFVYSFKILIKSLGPLHNIMPPQLEALPYSEIFLSIFIVFLAGIIFKFLVLRSIFNLVEYILFNLPLVRPIYFGVRQLVRAFTIQDQITFQKVVLVEYPRKGLHSIGFLTTDLPPEASPNTDKTYYSIYIPSTPNPATGYFVIASMEEIIFTKLNRQEAMALIISGGIIKPERPTQTDKE